MTRPKKETTKGKQIWVRCNEEQYKQLQGWAQNSGISVSEMALSKIFNIEIVNAPKIKECTHTVTTKAGKIKTYKQQYIVKRKASLKKENQ